MSKIRIKIVSIGHLPLNFCASKILDWKSSTFEVIGEIDNFALRCDSDCSEWGYSDALIKQQLPERFDADFLIAVVNIPIQHNWFSRRLGDNQIVFTFFETREILERYNIPIENVVYRMLYAYTLLYRRAGDKIPDFGEAPGFTHDETRGCLFDMNGIKTDLAASCDRPSICDHCREKLRQEKVSNLLIDSTQKEISRIRKDLYYRAVDFVRKHPLLSLSMSSAFALVLGITGSVSASFIYDGIKAALKPQIVVTSHPVKPSDTGEIAQSVAASAITTIK